MEKKGRKKQILFTLLILFVIAQAIQPTKNLGSLYTSTGIEKTLPIPDTVFALLKTSCYDCHSARTNYPWYDHITPVNWWVAAHINDGKRHLNFTKFGNYSKDVQLKKLDHIAETVKDGSMPLKSYLVMHGDAELTQHEKILITNWVTTSMQYLDTAR